MARRQLALAVLVAQILVFSHGLPTAEDTLGTEERSVEGHGSTAAPAKSCVIEKAVIMRYEGRCQYLGDNTRIPVCISDDVSFMDPMNPDCRM